MVELRPSAVKACSAFGDLGWTPPCLGDDGAGGDRRLLSHAGRRVFATRWIAAAGSTNYSHTTPTLTWASSCSPRPAMRSTRSSSGWPRWLLLAQDRIGEAEFPLTQEFVRLCWAQARPTVTVVAGTCKKPDSLRITEASSGFSTEKKLEEVSCECYEPRRNSYGAVTSP